MRHYMALCYLTLWQCAIYAFFYEWAWCYFPFICPDFSKGKTVFKHWLPGTCYSNITFQLVSEATINKSAVVRHSGVVHQPTQHRTGRLHCPLRCRISQSSAFRPLCIANGFLATALSAYFSCMCRVLSHFNVFFLPMIAALSSMCWQQLI